MRRLKKIACLLLCALVLITSLNIHIYADANQEDYSSLISALQNIESQKEWVGLENVEFADFKVSAPIQTYHYTADGFVEASMYYPLLIDGVLTALAIAKADGDDVQYQITTELVDEINGVVTSTMDFAIVYDSDGCYIYDGIDFVSIYVNSEPIEQRLSITDSAVPPSAENIALSNMKRTTSLGYSSPKQARVIIVYSCSVPVVRQPNNSSWCWAASVCSIVNYKNQTNYTIENVVQNWFGVLRNSGIPYSEVQSVLRQYGLTYYDVGMPNGSLMTYNIQADYPMYASFEVSGNQHHGVVITGFNPSNSCIWLMDPESDHYVYSYYSFDYETYWYESPLTGNLLLLRYATCFYRRVAE